ncbi:hypothetical protein JTE90_026943 [Oedothorax gibbosus]|uniref:Uncharacterized protein n=1 Tax=Oedothorax gibbosus TaxID=931172 RepID=A0AAV6TVH4_9ARAC|nr:hypothetical protein JTE90_026943 [Oedothorax gibbosus]
MSLSILDVTPKKKRNNSLKAEKSTSSKINPDKYGKADSETDSDFEKTPMIKKRDNTEKRPWTEEEKSTKRKKYDSDESDDSDEEKKPSNNHGKF